jgi:hypothetical protein
VNQGRTAGFKSELELVGGCPWSGEFCGAVNVLPLAAKIRSRLRTGG